MNFYTSNSEISPLTYLGYLFGVTLSALAAVSVFNFSVDPAAIYREKGVAPEIFAQRLLASRVGLYVPQDFVNERLAARALAQVAGHAECVVIGSSHVMQVSSRRSPPALPENCATLLNLGVSGAGIEDHITLSYLAATSGVARRVILGIDPWTFAYGTDPRWSAYRDDYLKAQAAVFGRVSAPAQGTASTQRDKLANLINFDYTRRSFARLRELWETGGPRLQEIEAIDPSAGGAEPARLNDGSLVYSAAYILAAKAREVPLGGEVYKTEGRLNEPQAIADYRALIGWLQGRGFEPILLLTPYHENVWKASRSPNVKAMEETLAVVRALGRDRQVRIIGSFNPLALGCRSSEFFDFMHPTAACLSRLERLTGG